MWHLGFQLTPHTNAQNIQLLLSSTKVSHYKHIMAALQKKSALCRSLRVVPFGISTLQTHNYNNSKERCLSPRSSNKGATPDASIVLLLVCRSKHPGTGAWSRGVASWLDMNMTSNNLGVIIVWRLNSLLYTAVQHGSRTRLLDVMVWG